MPRLRSVPSADEILTRDPYLRPHLDALGLTTAEEYMEWCARNGFSTSLKKHWHDRCHERYVASRERLQQRVTLAKQQQRKPRRTLERLFAGDLPEACLNQLPLKWIHTLLNSIDQPETRRAFERVILHVQSCTQLVSVQPALSQLGLQAGNTLIEGLLALAQVRPRWIRELENWQPRSHNVRRQFSSLAAHLLAKYPVPPFMDSAWFRGQSDNAIQQQEWYLALGAGQSPRRLELPIPLTKKMAHCFLQSPGEMLIESALRWAQVLGLGGDARLARAVLGSRLGTNFENNEFWVTVIRWLVDHPMLDTAQVNPIIDYIHHQKFEPYLVEGGQLGPQPLCPDFTMQGRTPQNLLNQMQEWHTGLRRNVEKPDLEWPPSGITPFELTEGTLAVGTLRTWTITELCSRRELFLEGQAMRHCVASYDTSCAKGRSSIWSMRFERNQGRRKHLLTIEVACQRRTICQVRGNSNRLPNQKELDIIRQWATQNQLVVDI
jgi:hypothetical protein